MKIKLLGFVASSFLLTSLFLVSAAKASSCYPAQLSNSGNGEWHYCKPIQITGSSAGTQTNYPVSILLDTASLISEGKTQPNLADLRFANSVGSELPFWIESGANSASTIIWVKADSIPSTGKTIYMYYGNPNSTLEGDFANSGHNTFEFFDDFDDSILNSSLWGVGQRYVLPSEQNGYLHLYAYYPYNGQTDGKEVQTVPTFTGNMIAEFNMTMNAQPAYEGWKSTIFTARIGSSTSAYYLPWADNISGWWSNGQYDCPAVNGGPYLGSLQIDAITGSLSMKLGATSCGTASFVPTTSPYVFNFTSEAGYGGDTVDFYDFRVRPIVSPEPVAGVPGAEEDFSQSPMLSFLSDYPNGLSTTTFNYPEKPVFKVLYTDAVGGHDGQVNVVVDGVSYSMIKGLDIFSNPFYYWSPENTFATGTYSYYFEGSDGLRMVRMPESGELSFEITKPNQSPELTFSSDHGYTSDQQESGKGVEPNKGVANKDALTFKIAYQGDTPPETVKVKIDQTIPLEKKFFTQLPYVSETDSGRLKKVDNSIRPGLPADAVGYHTGLLDYLGFDKDESFEFTPGGHPKREATADIYVSKVVNGSGSAYLKASLSAFDSSGVLVASTEKSIDVSTLAAGAYLSEKLSVVSQNNDIVKIKFKVTDITGSIIGIDAEAWIKSLSFKEELPMTRASLVDPDYKTGETFTASSVFPKGEYAYAFTASSTDGQVARLPATGSLSFTTGYSSVAFLPGIKGSRLYKEKTTFCVFNCEDQLWEPNWKTDVADLALNPNGESSNISIYTKTDPIKGLVDDANILQLWDPQYIWDPSNLTSENIYINFINSMADMVNNQEIAGWKALPYDWRLSFNQILSGGKEVDGKLYYDRLYTTETPFVLEGLRQLVQNSDSGKITIIAHSMGGLIVKKMMHDIEKESNHPYRDLLSKVETVILVDSPQLGTPQAVASMLHGLGEDLPDHLGLFSDKKTGRSIAQNMPSAYALLPSRDYAARVFDVGSEHTTLIEFDQSLNNILNDNLFSPTRMLGYFNSNYGTTTITKYPALKDFLLGTDGHLSANDTDIDHPKIIRQDLLQKAEVIHDEIDSWQAPTGVRVVQVAGWGIPSTIKGIRYKAHSEEVCHSVGISENLVCNYEHTFDEEPLWTFDGDGVVTLPSQEAMDVETYYVDLNAHNISFRGFKKNRTHASVLEVDDLLTLIKNVNKKIDNPSDGLVYIKTDKDQLDKQGLDELIRLSLHSPINVDVIDGKGNHLGVSPSSTSGRQFFDEQMPNSYYLKFGEGTYLGFPLEVSTTIQLQGTGTGTFTMEMEQYQGGSLEGTQTFTNIPVVTTTKAVLNINTFTDAKELALDQNGDGTVDIIAFTDENKEKITIQTLKSEIQKLSSKVKPALLVEVAIVEKQIKKGNYKAAGALLKVMKKEFDLLSRSKVGNRFQIENETALRLAAMVDVLIESIGE